MPQNTRTLKAVVIVLGVLLVVGFFVVIATIIIRLGNLGEDEASSYVAAAETGATIPAIEAPSAFDLPLAISETIKNFTLDGSRMAVHVQGPEGARLLIINLNDGSVSQTVRVTSAPK